MDQRDPALEKAILNWVNAVLPEQKIKRWSDFADGSIFWRLLADVDEEWFSGDLPEEVQDSDSNWIPRWQNLKHVDRAMSSYFTEKLSKPAHFGRSGNIDLKALAESGSQAVAIEMLQLLIYQLVHSSNSVKRQAALFESLGTSTSSVLVSMIQTLDAQEQKQVSTPRDVDSSSDRDVVSPQPLSRSVSKERSHTFQRDRELDLEEQLAEQIRDKKELKKRHETEREELLGAIEDLRTQLHDLTHSDARKLEERETREKLEHLTRKELSDRNVIADLEADNNELRSENASKQRHIERLQADETAKQELKDELQIVKAERDKLLNASNANENLKKKIRSLQDTEVKYKQLLEDTEANKEKVEKYDEIVFKYNALQRTTEENIQMIQTLELDSVTSSQRLKAMDYEKKLIEQELRSSREAHQRQAEELDELQIQLRNLQTGTPNEGASPKVKAQSLDDELAAGEKAESDLDRATKPESSVELQAQLLAALQKLQTLTVLYEKVKDQHLDVMLENVGLRNSNEKALSAQDIEKSDPFIKQQSKLLASEEELARLNRTHIDLVTERAELQDQLLRGPSADDAEVLDAADSEKFKVLQKSHDEIRKEFEDLKKQLEAKDTEAQDYKDLVFRSIRLQGDNEDPDKEEYLQTISGQIDMVRDATSTAEGDELRDGFANTYCGKLIGALDRVKTADREIKTMQAELDRTKKDGRARASDDAEKELTDLKRENANLRREIELMTTSWYSLTSRLQSNTVVLTRRTEQPKSWIRKQQAAVGGPHSARR